MLPFEDLHGIGREYSHLYNEKGKKDMGLPSLVFIYFVIICFLGVFT